MSFLVTSSNMASGFCSSDTVPCQTSPAVNFRGRVGTFGGKGHIWQEPVVRFCAPHQTTPQHYTTLHTQHYITLYHRATPRHTWAMRSLGLERIRVIFRRHRATRDIGHGVSLAPVRCTRATHLCAIAHGSIREVRPWPVLASSLTHTSCFSLLLRGLGLSRSRAPVHRRLSIVEPRGVAAYRVPRWRLVGACPLCLEKKIPPCLTPPRPTQGPLPPCPTPHTNTDPIRTDCTRLRALTDTHVSSQLLGQCTTKLCAIYAACNPSFNYSLNRNPRRALTEPYEGILSLSPCSPRVGLESLFLFFGFFDFEPQKLRSAENRVATARGRVGRQVRV